MLPTSLFFSIAEALHWLLFIHFGEVMGRKPPQVPRLGPINVGYVSLLKKLAHFESQHEVILSLTLRHLHFFIPFCFTEPLSLQFVFKRSLTLGTTLPRLPISYGVNAPTRSHAQNIPVYILAYTVWSCEVRSQPASAVLRFTLCSHVHAPPFHLVTVYLPVSLSVPLISHLSPQLSIFPSHLLSFHSLPLRLLLSASYRVCTDSVFCRCGAFMEPGVFSVRNGVLRVSYRMVLSRSWNLSHLQRYKDESAD